MTAMAGFLDEVGADGRLVMTTVLDHPFYFDHRLTHLPGLLLLDMSLHAIRREAMGQGRWIPAFDVDFRAIAALRASVHAEVTRRADGGWSCGLLQDGKLRAEACAAFAHDERLGEAHHFDDAGFAAIDRRFVRKSDPDNVFIASGTSGTWALRAPAASRSSLPACDGSTYSPVYIVEAFLQLCRTRRPEAYSGEGGPPASREILVRAGARMPHALPAGCSLTLAFDDDPETSLNLPPPRRGALRRCARLRAGEAPVGTIYCDAIPL